MLKLMVKFYTILIAKVPTNEERNNLFRPSRKIIRKETVKKRREYQSGFV
jgi:hypothetical protein